MAARLAPQRNFITITQMNASDRSSSAAATTTGANATVQHIEMEPSAPPQPNSADHEPQGRITIVNAADCKIITITSTSADDCAQRMEQVSSAEGGVHDPMGMLGACDENDEADDDELMDDKRYILPLGTTVTGLSVIDGVPMIHQLPDDDGDELNQHPQQHLHPHHLPSDLHQSDLQDHEAAESDDDADHPIAISLIATAAAHPASGASSPSSLHGSTSQQLTAQVAVAHSQEDMEPHYITVTAIDEEDYIAHDNVSTQETYHVQYVDSDQLYSTAGSQGQTQMPYPVYAVGDYTSSGQQYYTTTTQASGYGDSPTSSSQRGNGAVDSQHYILPSDNDPIHLTSRSGGGDGDSPPNCISDVSYMSQHNTTPTNSESECTPSLSHATRVSPATVSWLMDNYENADGVSLPRSTLYNHYMRHCNDHKLDAVNAASFGKLIRSVFSGLRTRRLGTRGNSKYHYYGIRVKPGSGLAGVASALDEAGGAAASVVVTTASSKVGALTGGGGSSIAIAATANSTTGLHQRVRKSGVHSIKPETYEACSQFLGDGHGAIPAFPLIEFHEPLPDDITLDDVDTLRSMYREHCEAFLDAILNLEFALVESLWREFWRSQDNNNGDECEEEKYLSKYKLYTLAQCTPVQEFVRKVDYTFYQNMVDVLLPDVLRPIPSTLTQAIRNFSKNLENWLATAMAGCPDSIVQIKVGAVVAFSQTLRRYTSLNHLAQAARAVLQNGQQISQMLSDLNRVDFNNVQEQASWVCQCDPANVQKLEAEFKSTLQQQSTLEEWASWLRQVVDNSLAAYRGKPEFERAARQFLLNWSFYSSMVIRDLTLRSAASFGSFHLIRLLYDEYMFYIVEHKVAEATDTTTIAVMMGQNRCSASTMGMSVHRSVTTHHDHNSDLDMMFCVDDFETKSESSPKRMRS